MNAGCLAFNRLHLGFVNSNAAKAKCSLLSASRI
jgi:hypothetical protein